MELERIIFKKSSKKQDCSVYIFQGMEKHEIMKCDYKSNLFKFIKKVNPSKSMYALTLEFSDYIVIEKTESSPALQ